MKNRMNLSKQQDEWIETTYHHVSPFSNDPSIEEWSPGQKKISIYKKNLDEKGVTRKSTPRKECTFLLKRHIS